MASNATKRSGKRYRDNHKKIGLCVRCPRPARPGMVTCGKCGKSYKSKPKWKKQEVKNGQTTKI